ncbi:MAG: hypothetical protein IJD58_10995 [Lachnospiraceae bacterium]|nr:hypothetical protein [Lachnospiraceae bacterium]
MKHRKAFLELEKKLLRKNTIRGYFHDVDKIILYHFLPTEFVHTCHQWWSKHHQCRAKTHDDFVQMVIDWECARFTKPDKPLNAYDTLYKFYPHMEDKILPILKELNLIK